MEKPFGLGSLPSPVDSRTFRHDTTLAGPLPEFGGHDYLPADIENQHIVGICTAISLIQNAQKAFGVKFSPDFQYLLQKKYYDLEWWEGSSIFTALKVGKNIGFLKIELFCDQAGRPYITEADRSLPYSQYVQKLIDIPKAEVERLRALCTHKLTGYASVKTDDQSLAKALLDSKSGLLVRYTVGKEWYSKANGQSSWNPKDIDPLRPPKVVISGHAIINNKYDYRPLKDKIELANTWGIAWNMLGLGHAILGEYPPTEAWIPYYDAVPNPAPPAFIFTKDMSYGDRNEDVRQLQKRLGVIETGYYGDLTRDAVYYYQLQNIELTFYERAILKGRICGFKTRNALNAG